MAIKILYLAETILILDIKFKINIIKLGGEANESK